jgi:methyl-accepting chemotaxis protein
MKLPLLGNPSLVHRICCIAIMAVLVCAAILGAIATWLAMRSLERQAEDTLKIVGVSSAVRIGDWITANQRLIASTVPAALTSPAALPSAAADPHSPQSTGDVSPDARLQQALQQTLSAGDYRIAFMAFERDARYVRAPAGPMPAGYNPTERVWYKQAVALGKPTIPTPYQDVQLHELNVTFEQPVQQGKTLLGVIGAIKPLTDVVKIIAAVKPTEHSYAFVMDGAGLVLIHPQPGFVLKPLTTVMPWFPLDPAGAVLAAHDGSRKVWVRTVPVPHSDWQLAVVLDQADTLTGLHTLVMSMLAAILLVAALAALAIVGWLRRSFAPLRQMRDAMVNVAAGRGDLTTCFDVVGTDEVSQIADAFNRFNEALRRIMTEVQSAGAEVKHAAQEIAIGNQDLSSRTEMQAHTVQASAASMSRIAQAATSNAAHAQQANGIAQEMATLAQAGGSKVADVVATMHEITGSSKRIGEIIGVIDGIAFQTNILALNAAVEAARAGEQGRGFAVVAGEVRSLAQRSAQAARDIRGLITQSSATVAAGAARVDDAGRTMSKVVESVHAVSQLMAQIVGATAQQSDGIGEVSHAVSQIDLMTQQNAALVEQAAAAAESLRDQSTRLMDAVGRFRT